MKLIHYLNITLACVLLTGNTNVFANNDAKPKIKAIAFDAFPLFDPRPIKQAFERMYPDQGGEIMEVWRTRLFEYQWLRVIGGEYKDFLACAEEAFIFTAQKLNLDLTPNSSSELRQTLLSLQVWPDTTHAVKELRRMGLDLVILSNMTEQMLTNGLKTANLSDQFKHVLSTDSIESYKPASVSYQLAVDKLGHSKDEILFVAFAGWDVAGAKWFGYPTYWVNRLNEPKEALSDFPDGEGQHLFDLVKFLTSAEN